MKRNLCYRHHTAEFDKLPDAMRHLAADWHTVEPCEVCEEQRADLLKAAEEALQEFEMLQEIPDTVNLVRKETVRRLRAASAGARGGE